MRGEYHPCPTCGVNLDPQEPCCYCNEKEAAPLTREQPQPKITNDIIAHCGRLVKGEETHDW